MGTYGTYGNERVGIHYGERVAGLQNARAANSPAAGQMTDQSISVIQAGKRIVEGEREAVRSIPGRGAIIVPRVETCSDLPWGYGVIARIILGLRARIRGIEEPVGESAAEIKDTAS